MKLLVAIASICLWSRTTVAESQQIRMATLAPAGSPWMDILDKATAEITEKTNGRITFKYYVGGQQGDERDYIRKIKLGQLDGAAITAMGLALIEPSILVLELPLMFKTLDEIDYVATKMWPYFQKKFEKKGFRLAERGELGWIHFFSKAKVTTIADLRKQKLCLSNDNQFGSTLVDKLKIHGVPLAIPEIDSALTSGKINACFNSPLGVIALQWHTKVKYMSSTPMVYALGATVMSLESVKKISAADQKIIEGVAKRSQKKARLTIRKANEDAKKVLVRKGITIVDPAPAMVEELTALGAAVQAQLVGKVFSKAELDMVIQYRDEYRAKHPEH